MANNKLLLGAAIFYIVLAPFFFHPDLKIIYQLASFLSQGVFNIYDFYSANPELFHLGPFVYPPAAYYLLGIFYSVVGFFAGNDFLKWLNMGNDAVDLPNIYRYLLAIKLPLIFAHLGLGWMLGQISDIKNKSRVMALWFFNPISIYVVAFMGQIDIFAAFCVVLSIFLAKRNPNLGALSLGLGAAIKSFPLLFLPFYILLVGKNWTERAKLAILGFGLYALFIAPFISSTAFWEQTFASGLSQRLLTLNVGGIPIVPVVLLSVLFLTWRKHMGQTKYLIDYFLVAGLIVLAGVRFHPQWALWVLPMLTVYVVERKKMFLGLAFFVGWGLMVLSFADRFLTWGLLSPLEKSVLYLPPPITFLPSTLSSVTMYLLPVVLIATCATYVAWQLFINNEVS